MIMATAVTVTSSSALAYLLVTTMTTVTTAWPITGDQVKNALHIQQPNVWHLRESAYIKQSWPCSLRRRMRRTTTLWYGRKKIRRCRINVSGRLRWRWLFVEWQMSVSWSTISVSDSGVHCSRTHKLINSTTNSTQINGNFTGCNNWPFTIAGRLHVGWKAGYWPGITKWLSWSSCDLHQIVAQPF